MEARGVEPLSERTATKVSPSAAGVFLSPSERPPAGFLRASPVRFPAAPPGPGTRRVSLLGDAHHRPAGEAGWTGRLIKQPERIRCWQLFFFHRFTGGWNPGSLPLLLIPPSKPVRPQSTSSSSVPAGTAFCHLYYNTHPDFYKMPALLRSRPAAGTVHR